MEKKTLLEELDDAIEKMNEDVISKLDIEDNTLITKKELRAFMTTIHYELLAIRDVIEILHREDIRK